jgi:hypothetical protein
MDRLDEVVLKKYKAKFNIILLGMNPSGQTDNPSKECMLKYYEDLELRNPKAYEGIKKAKLVYKTYHNKNFELISDNLNSKDNILLSWQTKNGYDFFKKEINKMKWNKFFTKNNINKDDMLNALYKFVCNKKNKIIVYFHDLVPNVHEKKQEKVKLKDKAIKKYISDFLKKVKNNNVKLVIVTNAKASHWLLKELNNGEEIDKITKTFRKGLKTTFIFSGMVTGQRALDNFNYLRLKKSIRNVLLEMQKG